MKQILQSLKTGAIEIADVPNPVVGPHELLVGTHCTMVSAGTERMLLKFGQAGWISKARQQPDKVREVVRKIKNDGVGPTINAVRNKLDQPLPLGYCNVGTVLSVGEGVRDFAPGQRVVTNGKHAGIVAVPSNLAALVPDSVSDEDATMAVIGAIALEAVRLTEPTLGESVIVAGLGLVGLAAVQLLLANGCRVLGLDFASERLAMARSFGAETFDLGAGPPLEAATRFSGGRGADAVLVAASTISSEPISQAATMCRKRGRIVLAGVTGLELSRADFYEKELTFQVSCSYGPGRYDPAYEEDGADYPFPFVRWTAQRNFEAVLDLVARGRFDARSLISHRFRVDEAHQAYGLIGGGEASLGVILQFGEEHRQPTAGTALAKDGQQVKPKEARIAMIGAGNYAGAVLIPAFKAAGAQLTTVVSATGVSALHASRKFGFAVAAANAPDAIRSLDTDTVVIATRHNLHADQTVAALTAGKHVFAEKPLAITLAEVDRVETAWQAANDCALMVGFNRRFSPLAIAVKKGLDARGGPKAMIMTINAGALPAGHWTMDPTIGGGRIIGEGVHFVDLARFLAGAPITAHHVSSISTQSALIQLEFSNGDVASISYLANGNKSVSKERIEVFCDGAIYQIDNWRKLTVMGDPATGNRKLWVQDKGQKAMARAFVAHVRGKGRAPIPPEELFETARITILIADTMHRQL
jgi:predicted dehydrogenase/threonine dehydrogenase-like Zn-dependent dehydrogenase